MAVGGGYAAPRDRAHAVPHDGGDNNSTSGGCGLARRGGSGGVGVATVEWKTDGRRGGEKGVWEAQRSRWRSADAVA